jgi:hypothetical protein
MQHILEKREYYSTIVVLMNKVHVYSEMDFN